MVAGPEDEDVALAEPDALGLLAGLELGPGHGLARLEPLHPAEARDVEQHAAADEAVPVVRDVEGCRALRGQHLLGGLAVVDLALVRDVAQRVDVGVAVAVAGHPQVVEPEAQAARADVDVVGLADEVDRRVRVVRSGDLVDRDLHRDPPARPDEPGRVADAGRGDVVEGAELVVRPPAPPVLDRFEDRVELRHGHQRAFGRGRHRTASISGRRRGRAARRGHPGPAARQSTPRRPPSARRT